MNRDHTGYGKMLSLIKIFACSKGSQNQVESSVAVLVVIMDR